MIMGVYLIAVNLITFVIFGYDKHQAKAGGRRVPERVLFLLAAVGGSIGALAGMYYFHHKTLHTSFRLGMPAILVAQIIVLYLLSLGTR